MNPVLAAAFVLGLAGSAHCIGMCGPIALAVPSSSPRWGARLLSTLIRNSGRLFTYAPVGARFRCLWNRIAVGRSATRRIHRCGCRVVIVGCRAGRVGTLATTRPCLARHRSFAKRARQEPAPHGTRGLVPFRSAERTAALWLGVCRCDRFHSYRFPSIRSGLHGALRPRYLACLGGRAHGRWPPRY
ncbi:MAG: sulfite exporter TauE/SafE family protein [Flavobacteriales bacterium]|nr:sulfite exporter TauE/SafE family protein [Flavobacteriales bacterium]